MRSQTEYIITKSEVHAYAEDWLGTAIRFEYQGYKCSKSVLLKVLLIAAARVVSVFAACRSLADAPTDQTIRNALAATLPEMIELERRLNLAVVKRAMLCLHYGKEEQPFHRLGLQKARRVIRLPRRGSPPI